MYEYDAYITYILKQTNKNAERERERERGRIEVTISLSFALIVSYIMHT